MGNGVWGLGCWVWGLGKREFGIRSSEFAKREWGTGNGEEGQFISLVPLSPCHLVPLSPCPPFPHAEFSTSQEGDVAMTPPASDVPDEGSFFAREAGDTRMGE